MPVHLRFQRADRSSVESLQSIKVQGSDGLVPLGELVRVEKLIEDKSIYHKNLQPVTYVTADVAGREESPVYAILKMAGRSAGSARPKGTRSSSTPRASLSPPRSSRSSGMANGTSPTRSSATWAWPSPWCSC